MERNNQVLIQLDNNNNIFFVCVKKKEEKRERMAEKLDNVIKSSCCNMQICGEILHQLWFTTGRKT